MIVVVEKDGYANVGGLYVYGLQYDDETELTGAELDTENDGHIRCRAGSFAWKVGLADMKQLSNDETWEDLNGGD